jgi:hypothetical protein
MMVEREMKVESEFGERGRCKLKVRLGARLRRRELSVRRGALLAPVLCWS